MIVYYLDSSAASAEGIPVVDPVDAEGADAAP